MPWFNLVYDHEDSISFENVYSFSKTRYIVYGGIYRCGGNKLKNNAYTHQQMATNFAIYAIYMSLERIYFLTNG